MLNVFFTPTDTIYYTTASASVFINVLNATQITQITPTITWNNPADIIYGTPLSNAQLDATASVPGTFVYNPPSGTILSVGQNQQLNTIFIPTDTINYTTASATSSINVTQATPTVIWNNPDDIVYGTQLSGIQLDANASAPGTFVYNPPSGTVLNTGMHTLSVSFTPTDTTNYTTASATSSINVSVPGTFVYIPPSGTVLSAGMHTLDVSFTPTDTVHYNTASSTASINVAKVTPTIIWSDPANITYGTALNSIQLDANASVPGKFVYTPQSGNK